MAVKTYNPKQLIITFGGILLSGYADGTVLTVERNEDAVTTQIGTDGEGTRSLSNNKSGTATVQLMQSSASNDALSAIAKLDEDSGAGALPFIAKDVSGRTVVSAETAWIRRLPSMEFSREAGPREWVFESDNMNIFVGGN